MLDPALIPDHQSWALVLGDLALDLTASLPEHVTADSLVAKLDVDVSGDVSVRAGGSAWMFSSALARVSTVRPVISSVLGEDWAGDFLHEEMVRHSFSPWAVYRTADAVTKKVLICSFAGGHRIMVASKESRTDYAKILRSASQLMRRAKRRPAFAWISGYVLAAWRSTGIKWLADLCDKLRILGTPIVLDLVPHDFRQGIGSVHEIEQAIGHVDVLVGELRTVIGLGYGDMHAIDLETDSLIEVAGRLSHGRLGAIVQHRTHSDKYSQAIAGSSLATPYLMHQHIADNEVRGIGDLLAVRGLANLLPIATVNRS